MLREKRLHRFIDFEAVLFVAEAVAFVLLDDVGHIDAARAEHLDDLIRLVDIHARVLRALDHHEWRANLIDMKHRTRGREHLLVGYWIADHFVHAFEEWLPVWRDRLHKGEEIRDALKNTPRAN